MNMGIMSFKMSNNIYYHARARLLLMATSLLYCPDLVCPSGVKLLTQSWRKPTPPNPTPGTHLHRGRDHCPRPPPAHRCSSNFPPRQEGALTSLALGAGQARDEEGRAATTEGPLHRRVPGGGGRWWSGRPLSLSPLSPVQPAAGLRTPLTAAIRAASLWSSPCGSKTSPVPGSRGPARGRSEQPEGRSRHWGPSALGRLPVRAPQRGLTWYRKLSLWKASRSFTCPAIRAALAPHTPQSTGPTPG